VSRPGQPGSPLTCQREGLSSCRAVTTEPGLRPNGLSAHRGVGAERGWLLAGHLNVSRRDGTDVSDPERAQLPRVGRYARLSRDTRPVRFGRAGRFLRPGRRRVESLNGACSVVVRFGGRAVCAPGSVRAAPSTRRRGVTLRFAKRPTGLRSLPPGPTAPAGAAKTQATLPPFWEPEGMSDPRPRPSRNGTGRPGGGVDGWRQDGSRARTCTPSHAQRRRGLARDWLP
jgi:hypothetical protein